MAKILDMQLIRYLNVFYKFTRIRAKHCFIYNNVLVFAVPKRLVKKAIGENNRNLEKLSRVLERKIRIVGMPSGIEDLENFLALLIKPIKFKNLELNNDELVINVGNPNKASLIGREKCRLNEMKSILEQYFGIRKIKVK